MKRPKSELPWFYDKDIGGYYFIYNKAEDGDVEEWIVDKDSSPNRKDCEYIVEACNNYPKAVDLLLDARDMLLEVHADNSEVTEEICDFLESIGYELERD